MGLLHRKSRWERMIEPVAGGGGVAWFCEVRSGRRRHFRRRHISQRGRVVDSATQG